MAIFVNVNVVNPNTCMQLQRMISSEPENFSFGQEILFWGIYLFALTKYQCHQMYFNGFLNQIISLYMLLMKWIILHFLHPSEEKN